jgi:hypothetical protein
MAEGNRCLTTWDSNLNSWRVAKVKIEDAMGVVYTGTRWNIRRASRLLNYSNC